MKPLKAFFLYLSITGISVLTGCQEKELNSFHLPADDLSSNSRSTNRPDPGNKAPNTVNLILPSSIVKQEYAQATSWLVTWNNPKWEYRSSLAGVFSTVDGSFHSFNSLNQSTWENTAKADMDLLFGRIQSLENGSNLVHQAHTKATRFKPSSLTLIGFVNALQNNPALFQQEFENSPDAPTQFQPYNYEAGGGDNVLYQTGEIYLFKTDRTPAVYGAIRIVEGSNIVLGDVPRVIEIVVQKSNAILIP